MNDIKFVWDDEKEKVNIRKHGISFSVAAKVFDDPDRIEIYDNEHSVTEDRYNVIGMVNEIMFVVYTERSGDIRLISARLATKLEQEAYWYGRN